MWSGTPCISLITLVDILICNPQNNGHNTALGVEDLYTSSDAKMLHLNRANLFGSQDLG